MTLDISFFTAERADADVDQWRRRNVDHDRHDHDMGTPPADRSREGSPATVPVNIDGQDVLVPEGTSVMRAAAICGVDKLIAWCPCAAPASSASARGRVHWLPAFSVRPARSRCR